LATQPAESETRLSVVVPGYNESASIAAALERYRRALDALGVSYEVIVIDDASTDDTGAIADAFAAANPRFRVIRNPLNVNVGQSILIGYRIAQGEIVTHNAVDLPFDPADLARVLPMFDDPELAMVVVSRTDRSAHSLWRKLTSLGHHWMVRALFWSALPDMNFVQVCRRSAVADLGVRARSPAFVTPEMIIRARDAGLKIGHFAATFHARKAGEAKFGKPRDILWTLADMLSFRLERRTDPRRRRGPVQS